MNVFFFFLIRNEIFFDRKYQSVQLLWPPKRPKENQISTTPETTYQKHV